MSKRIIVVGAGAWGGWTAYHLQKSGCEVTLIDKQGPGNPWAGSGGKSRIIRLAYGGNKDYTDLTEESLKLWKHYSESWEEDLFHQKEALWLFREVPPTYAELSIPLMEKRGYCLAKEPIESLKERYPEINFSDITSAFIEPEAGYLEANRACEVVKDRFEHLGGKYIQANVIKLLQTDDQVEGVILDSGEKLSADYTILACGPWLSELVPAIRPYIHISRQEVYYFKAPSHFYNLPIWLEFRAADQMFYGIPDHFKEGFKFAYDERTWALDLNKDERGVTKEILHHMRKVLKNRFPELTNAEVLKHHTCVYENSRDGDFIIDKIPGCKKAIILAGSSGHGFKMGPAIGKLIADHVLEDKPIPSSLSLARFTKNAPRKSQYEVN
ncbi:NAD(P)/FAD-dependent oxidoreductase [Roseivirga sp.]|uniref:NAD(P)/FAD-dependent oxidoreductase n=1 Tax=Roseivirga sp. TaxID=1964215 RepID=UPI003B8BFFC1